jgi:hypothetical protein
MGREDPIFALLHVASSLSAASPSAKPRMNRADDEYTGRADLSTPKGMRRSRGDHGSAAFADLRPSRTPAAARRCEAADAPGQGTGLSYEQRQVPNQALRPSRHTSARAAILCHVRAGSQRSTYLTNWQTAHALACGVKHRASNGRWNTPCTSRGRARECRALNSQTRAEMAPVVLWIVHRCRCCERPETDNHEIWAFRSNIPAATRPPRDHVGFEEPSNGP